ncbi:MAG: class I SAM-dependent methyltransferase, partial [Xenococcus sp. (in: cyanobacteria)]
FSSGAATIYLNDRQQQALQQFQSKLERGIYSVEEVSCLCGSVDDYLIAKRDRYGLSFDTCLCKNCGLLRTRNRLTSESLSKFYNEDYRPIYGGDAQVTDAFFSEQIQHGKNIYDFITSNIAIASHSKVFDVGCGAGGILIPFKEAGWSTFGCDLGGNYLERGKAEGLLLKHGNINSLMEFGKADLVILSHVIEHFLDPIFELKRIRETLVDGGYLYVELPGIFAIHKTYGKTVNFLQNAHLYHFTLGTLTSVLAQAGFKLVRGDEHIHALFQKDDNVENSLNSARFHEILNYLYFVELRKFLLPLLNNLNRGRNILVKVIKALLGDRFVNYLKRILK